MAHKAYGRRHQAIRLALIATMPEGSPCYVCGQPMSRAEPLDLCHEPGDKALGLPGRHLGHRRCNRATSKPKPKQPKPLTIKAKRKLAALQMAEAALEEKTGSGRYW